MQANTGTHTIGTYLATRLAELKVKDYFAIPGDYNLALLDEILKNPELNMINCCNELNAGYAADGYARINGLSALFVTFSVGGLSAINAVAGAYAENLPVIVVSGGPNTHSVSDAEILHHTLANEDHLYVRDMFARVTAHAVRVQKPENAGLQIDKAISICLQEKKPVYIEIACNIANYPIAAPAKHSFSSSKTSDKNSLSAAVKAVSERLNNAVKPVLILGSKSRPCHAADKVSELSKATGYALAAMPDAKGFVSEEHENYIGIYWGEVSSNSCSEIVDSSDCYLFIGANENDYTTVGHSWGINPAKKLSIAEGSVRVGDSVFNDVYMNDFLVLLAKHLNKNTKSIEAYRRISENEVSVIEQDSSSPVARKFLFQQIQQLLSSDYAVLAETGDSWFNGMDLNLPTNCPFEIQMQYGSIGWSVGALLGMQAALHNQKRVIACIGDGSFQMSAQEVSTMVRYGFKPIIFLMNNASYTIEVQIHDGPYNVINQWNYADLVHAFNGKQTGAKGYKVTNNQELLDAIADAKATDALCFIEVMLDKDDCNKNLLSWGARVANYNGRKPAGR